MIGQLVLRLFQCEILFRIVSLAQVQDQVHRLLSDKTASWYITRYLEFETRLALNIKFSVNLTPYTSCTVAANDIQDL